MAIAPHTAPPMLDALDALDALAMETVEPDGRAYTQLGLGTVPAGCALHVRFHSAGQVLFGQRWSDLRPGLVASWTRYRETSSRRMTVREMTAACDEMERSTRYGLLCYLGRGPTDEESRCVRYRGVVP